MAQTPPTAPIIGTAYDNVTVSNSNVDGGTVASANSSLSGATLTTSEATDTTVINDAIAYVSSQGGGTVEVPASASSYITSELLMKNNVDLVVDSGATLQNKTPGNTYITTSSSNATHDIEISGGGIINGNATSTSNNHMVLLGNITDIEIKNVTLENASNEHLVVENDNNLTVNNVTIQDPLGLLANTDGVDFSGNNVLIENCNISDGDDDIVAKPTVPCSNIYITNDTFTAGHGISIGGQTNAGLNGMYVSNLTEDGTAANPLEDGIHLKAGDGSTSAYQNGGLVQNVTFNNITMNYVDDALVVDSFYNNGESNYPGKPSATSPFPVAPTDSTEPLWKDITFENITGTNVTGNAADMYGLNSTPANFDGVNYENVTLTAGNPWNMYYTDDIYMSGVTVNGTNIPDSLANLGGGVSQEYADTFDASANPIYVVPEPASLGLIGAVGLGLLRRRRGRR
jgi:polygalacturonase